jgi:hypothetical protein
MASAPTASMALGSLPLCRPEDETMPLQAEEAHPPITGAVSSATVPAPQPSSSEVISQAAAAPEPQPLRAPPPIAPQPLPATPSAVPLLDTKRHTAQSRTRLSRRSAQIALMIVGGAILLAVPIALLNRLRPVPPEPSVGTAIVAAGGSMIYGGPGEEYGAIATLPGNERVNVLAAPRDASQQWVKVQSVNGRELLPPGYMKAAVLDGWDSDSVETARNLVKNLWRQESEAEIETKIARLDQLGERFALQRAGQEALLDAGELRLQLAGRRRASGQPEEMWRGDVQRVVSGMSNITAPSLATRAVELRNAASRLITEAEASKARATGTPAAPRRASDAR